MTTVLSDAGRLRFEAISFFVLVLLLSAAAVWGMWNLLRRDFPRLPRIGIGRSLGVVALWGLLFLVTLTMIASAREMMMPGIWARQGLLYSISPPAEPAK
jgi:hypothetical protein